jgi:hypothetical protein
MHKQLTDEQKTCGDNHKNILFDKAMIYTVCPQMITMISTGCNTLTMKLTEYILLQLDLGTHKVSILVSSVTSFATRSAAADFL